VLAAAEELFAAAAAPARLSMDDVATAAGVGKGTLFRAFGRPYGHFGLSLSVTRSRADRRRSARGPIRASALLPFSMPSSLSNSTTVI
jgi:hypothetical protein